jgi:hypothetical protein
MLRGAEGRGVTGTGGPQGGGRGATMRVCCVRVGIPSLNSRVWTVGVDVQLPGEDSVVVMGQLLVLSKACKRW